MTPIAAALLLALAPATAADPCANDPHCVRASAPQLFVAAEQLAKAGDLAGAAVLLDALTADPDLQYRTEARFRLAALREKAGDRRGAIAALRALLADKPDAQRARLELGRLLSLEGDAAAAHAEFDRARQRGLPPDVARTVNRFSSAIVADRKRGGSVELVAAFDSNINRATQDRYLDTVIAPFLLDGDARARSGVGLGLGLQLHSRDQLGGVTLLSQAGAHADLFAASRFDDVQLSLASGPELAVGGGRLRLAALGEARWFGGHPYSRGLGASIGLTGQVGATGQLELAASATHQRVDPDPLQSGERYSLSLSYARGSASGTSFRLGARAAAIDARARPNSLIQGTLDALVAHDFGPVTLFGQVAGSRLAGAAPLALFGKPRRDWRLDLAAGASWTAARIAGFTPLARLLFTDAHSTIGLYTYRRLRAEVGLARDF